ncbi:MAG: hypothetical protein EXR27_17835 [Betaproteobacteria bacterium]|nr:hypothetical protein [Betaproteobacteria bacterium]
MDEVMRSFANQGSLLTGIASRWREVFGGNLRPLYQPVFGACVDTRTSPLVPSAPLSVVSSAAVTPDWLVLAVDRLNQLLSMPAGWNTYGATRVSGESAWLTLQVLGSLPNKYGERGQISPLEDGSLQIGWHHADKGLELVLRPNGTAEMYFYDANSENEYPPAQFQKFMPELPGLLERVLA